MVTFASSPLPFYITTFMQEYNCLLKIFAKCHQCIEARRFRLLFVRPIRQAIQYYLQMKKNNTEADESVNNPVSGGGNRAYFTSAPLFFS